MDGRRTHLSVLVTGDCRHREFETSLAWLHRNCQVTRLPNVEMAHSWLAAGSAHPHMIVIAQPRPGRHWQSQIEALHAAAPLARLVALLGSWCEGEPCSGEPWSGVIRVYWHEFVARLEAEWADLLASSSVWSLPRTATDSERIERRSPQASTLNGELIMVGTPSAVVYEGLAEACTQAGFASAWWAPSQPCRVHAAAAGIWDGTGRETDALPDLTKFSQRVAPAPVLALIGFPRRYECDLAINAGAKDVVPKPFLIADLASRLRRLMQAQRERIHEAPAA